MDCDEYRASAIQSNPAESKVIATACVAKSIPLRSSRDSDMAKDDPTSQQKSHKKERKKLKNLYQSSLQPPDDLRDRILESEASRPAYEAPASSHALINKSAAPQSTVAPVQRTKDSRCMSLSNAVAIVLISSNCVLLSSLAPIPYAEDSSNALQSRFELGPLFQPVQVEPLLDCSDFDADTHELWLLQLPMDVGPPLQPSALWPLLSASLQSSPYHLVFENCTSPLLLSTCLV